MAGMRKWVRFFGLPVEALDAEDDRRAGGGRRGPWRIALYGRAAWCTLG